MLHRNDAQVILAQMMTCVELGATCYPNPDDDTCRVGCEPRVQSVIAWREKKNLGIKVNLTEFADVRSLRLIVFLSSAL